MSLTYISAIAQFFVVMGLITTDEADIVEKGIMAIGSLVLLGYTLYGRFRIGGVSMFGLRK